MSPEARWVMFYLIFSILFTMPVLLLAVFSMLPLALFLLGHHLPTQLTVLDPIGGLVICIFLGLRIGLKGADWATKRFLPLKMKEQFHDST